MNIRKLTPLAALAIFACGPAEENDNNDGSTLEVPSTYTFASSFEEDASSISYSGQTFRHLLIKELNAYNAGLTAAIDGGTFQPTDDGDVMAAFDFYLRFDSATSGSETFNLSIDGTLAQSTFDDVSSDKDLVGKLAGNDTATDHVDWNTGFAGWKDASIAANGGAITNPTGLVTAFLETLEKQAIDRVNGTIPTGPTGEPIAEVFVTPEGLDLKQLTEKFLVVGIAFHQGADDYLDDDVEGKGLLASNAQSEGKTYSALEHAWDEGFGYFGAAQAYGDMSDDDIASKGWADADSSGTIDLKTEYCFGHSVNAAKRDNGSQDAAKTDFTKDAFEGFLEGRTIITRASAEGRELTDDELVELKAARDQAVGAWEKSIASTAVHYVNDTLGDMDAFGTDDYSFEDHAKHWSELKGFALGLQFNPKSPVSDAKFVELHDLIGDAPVLPNAEPAAIDAYRADLIAARDLLRDAYGFDASNAEGW